MNPERIIVSSSDRICRIVLNRPEKRNALDDTMVAELTEAFRSAGASDAVKVILLSANGTAFCAGADLAYLQQISRNSLEQNREDSRRLAGLFEAIITSRKPVIAAVNGPALAGGCGLATVCDIVIASESARFGYTEVRIGFIPALVMTFLIRRVGEGRARELLLRGNSIDAGEAKAIGLVNMVADDGSLDANADALCHELITQNSGTAMALTKKLLWQIGTMDIQAALDVSAGANAEARMTPECRKGIAAFLTRTKIEW